MDAAKTVTAGFILKPVNYMLNVSKSGSGSGTVSGGAISCGSTCLSSLSSGSQVTLTATPELGSSFAGWMGACTGTGNCTLTMDEEKSVTALFEKNIISYNLNVSKSGDGDGLVSSDSGIDCGSVCALTAVKDTQVTLIAQPDASSSFAGWSGACNGSSLSCSIPLDAAKTVTASFTATIPPAVPVTIVDGYTDAQSYEQNSLQTVYLNAASQTPNASVELYNVLGEVVDTVVFNALPQQPTNPEPWANGFGYTASFTYDTGNLPSGLYFWGQQGCVHC